MGCTRAFEDDQAAQYVGGQLAEDARDAFERHCFECPDCLEAVEALTGVREVLAERPRRQAPAVPRWAWAAGLAAVGVGAAILLRSVEPTPPVGPATPGLASTPPSDVPPPGPDLAELARFEPPGYVALSFRGSGAEPSGFAPAMELYSRRDYLGAARALRAVVREHPEAAAPRFYLGICELVAGRAEAGARELAAAARSGDPVYASAARFYLGRAYLARGDVASARSELRAVVGSGGDLAREARTLLRALDPAGPPR